MSDVRSTPTPIQPRRSAYGPRPLAALLPPLLKPSFDRRPAASATLLADWPLIVGAALARTTQPRRLAAGTLTIACPGPTALELQHSTDLLIARINQHMGHTLVQRLRLVQEPLTRPTTLPPTQPGPSAEDRAALAHRLGDMQDGPLRDALTTLGLALHRR